MNSQFGEYRLRCELRGHKDDARGISICDDIGIATSSRDGTVNFWIPEAANKNKYVLSKTFVGHSSFVGPLAWIAPDENHPEGQIVSGGMDALIFQWDLRTGQCVETMKGHQLQVTGLAIDDNQDIVSSSVDCTIRRWRKGQLFESWEGHKAAIQAIIKLPSGEFVTGSSDKTLKLWRGRSCSLTFVGHKDTVRDLALMPGLGVVSGSHDGSIRLWTLTGQMLMEMVGHTSLVYSVATHTSGHIVSGSEDCFAKIWKDGICLQSIEHPGCVWDTKFLDNGDIVTACSDGVVRIWTTKKCLMCDESEFEAYSFQLSEYKCNRKKVGGLKLMELPGLEALQVPGTSDGQTKVIREGDNGVAYSWNAREHNWDKIGEVVDGPDDSFNRTILDGVPYDYVFDVDIGDGEPIRKLPYNRSDNAYITADKWLLKENLPTAYRQQIVDFILKNSGQSDFVYDSSFRDPYTGANAYVPGSSSMISGLPVKRTFKHIPKKGMLFFDAAQFDGILKKMTDFNNVLLSNSTLDLLLTELEMSQLVTIVKILKDTSHYHCTTFTDNDISLLMKLLVSWPHEMMFPVIDILRMIVLHPDGARVFMKRIDETNDVMELLMKATKDSSFAANFLTSIRFVVNLFKHSFFHPWLLSRCSEILDSFSRRPSPNKNLNISYATLILNYAVLLIEKRDEEGQSQVLSAAIDIAEDGDQDPDSKFRAFVAIGSLMMDGLVKKIALDFDIQDIAKVAKDSEDTRLSEVGEDIEFLIKSS